jgi:hypothetical protein
MTVSLKSNFLLNARGFTLLDSASVTWAINQTTNAVTATSSGGGGGGLTSVGLSDASTAPIYTVGASPLTANGTLTITFKTQSANTVLAGPTTGSAAQPTFRALVVADVPTLNQNTTGNAATATNVAYSGLTGSVPTWNQNTTGNAATASTAALLSPVPTWNQNTTGTAAGLSVTLAIASGGTGQTSAAAAYNALSPMTTKGDMEYDSAAATAARLAIGATSTFLTVASGIPAWSTNTVPSTDAKGDIWYASAANVISGLAIGSTGNLLTVTGGIPAWEAVPTWNQNTSGTAAGLSVTLAIASGGTGQTSAAAAYNALSPMTNKGDIEYDSAAATAARLAIGTTGQVLTVASGIPSWATPAASANPTGTIGLAAVNGTAATWMTSDSAPKLSQTISPTMTGNWVFTPTSGAGPAFNGTANNYAATFVASSTSGQSYGPKISAGTTSADSAFQVTNQAATANYLQVRGDGLLTIGGGTVLTAATPTVSAGQVGFGSTTGTATATTVGGVALAALAAGFLTVNIGGTNYGIPYFAL